MIQKPEPLPETQVIIAKMITGNIVGLEDILTEKQNFKYSSTVKCLSNHANVYCIPYEHFLEQVLRYSEQMKFILEDYAKTHLKLYDQIINAKQQKDYFL